MIDQEKNMQEQLALARKVISSGLAYSKDGAAHHLAALVFDLAEYRASQKPEAAFAEASKEAMAKGCTYHNLAALLLDCDRWYNSESEGLR